MPFLNVSDVSKIGIVTDALPSQIPPGAWTGGQNVRIRDGQIQKFKGEEEYLDPDSGSGTWDGGANGQIYWALPAAEGAIYHWIYCGLEDVRIYDGTTDVEITRAAGDYSATAELNWTGGLIGGIPIINNGVDDPQFLASFDLVTPVKFADLTNWPASTTCKAMRVFKGYLIAMNVTKSSTDFPTLVKWSDAVSQAGQVPSSWDNTDPTVDAGENDLVEAKTDISTGVILDGAQLRDQFIIYRDDSTWGMRFIGGSLIFQFYQISSTQGMLTRRCMAEFQGKHFVVSNGDVFVHDGSNLKSVINNKRKRFLFSDIDPNNYERTYVFHNLSETEMWICYVESGHASGLPNKALVWNYTFDTWTTRELPDAPHIERGVVDTSPATDDWTVADGSWEDWTVAWGQIGFNPMDSSPLICSTKLLKGDSTDQFDGTNMTSRIERLQLPIGQTKQDPSGMDTFVRIKRVYPHMTGSGAVNISVGTHKFVEDPVTYKAAKSFTPGTDRKIDVNAKANLMALKIETTSNVEWSLSGYDIEYEIVGHR